jgi:hypothetical protein
VALKHGVLEGASWDGMKDQPAALGFHITEMRIPLMAAK